MLFVEHEVTPFSNEETSSTKVNSTQQFSPFFLQMVSFGVLPAITGPVAIVQIATKAQKALLRSIDPARLEILILSGWSSYGERTEQSISLEV